MQNIKSILGQNYHFTHVWEHTTLTALLFFIVIWVMLYHWLWLCW